MTARPFNTSGCIVCAWNKKTSNTLTCCPPAGCSFTWLNLRRRYRTYSFSDTLLLLLLLTFALITYLTAVLSSGPSPGIHPQTDWQHIVCSELPRDGELTALHVRTVFFRERLLLKRRERKKKTHHICSLCASGESSQYSRTCNPTGAGYQTVNFCSSATQMLNLSRPCWWWTDGFLCLLTRFLFLQVLHPNEV